MIFGLWHGGSSYSTGYPVQDVETFDSREDALQALRDRCEHGDWQQQEFRYVNRDAEFHYCPSVSDDSSMTLWTVDPTHDEDPYTDDVVRHDDAMDVWLRFVDGDDDEAEAEAEANTFRGRGGYIVKWYLTAVGLVKERDFATYDDAAAFLTSEGFTDYSS